MPPYGESTGNEDQSLLQRILPAQFDNRYRGHAAALWIFGLVSLMKLGISLGSIFNGREAATSADGIPIDSYGPDGANTVLSLFGLLGLSNVMLALIAWLALIRYRTMVPLMFVVFLVYQLSRKLVLEYLPVVRTGAPPGGMINTALLLLMVVGLALSIWDRKAQK